MSNLAFVVLLPNARRETIKVNLDMSMLQILEDVCDKQGLNANEWHFKHFSRVIELGNSVRFSGLPNNATLEMVQSLKPRKESAVTIVLQLESGKRLAAHQFYPYETLWNVLEFWVKEGEKDVLPVVSSSTTIQPVCIYMRQDIASRNKLEERTLRSLGLFHGSAVIRLLHRTQNQIQFNHQPNVSTRLASSSSTSTHPHSTDNVNSKRSTQMSKENRTNVHEKKDKDKEKQNNGTTSTNKQTIINKQTSSKAKSSSQHSREKSLSKNSTDAQQVQKSLISSSIVPPSPKQLHAQPGHLHMFVEFDAMLYHADDVKQPDIESPPNEFYEVTEQDVKSVYRNLQAARKQLEDAPLQTRSARNLEHDNAVQARTSIHPITIVRIRFPDRYCLQGTFKTNDSTRLLYSFVRGFLENSQLNFYLFTTPPKRILAEDKTLIEVGLIGFVVIYVGCNDKPVRYIKKSFYDKISDPEQVFKYSPQSGTVQARKNGGNSSQNKRQNNDDGAEPSNVKQEPAGTSSHQQRSTRTRSNNPQFTDTNNVPKWFKVGKKF